MLQKSTLADHGTAHGHWRPTASAEGATVLGNEAVNSEYRHLVLSCSAMAASARPGQFFQLLCPQPDGEAPFLRRPLGHPTPGLSSGIPLTVRRSCIQSLCYTERLDDSGRSSRNPTGRARAGHYGCRRARRAPPSAPDHHRETDTL